MAAPISSTSLVRAPKPMSEGKKIDCMLSVVMVILEDDRNFARVWVEREAQGREEEERDS